MSNINLSTIIDLFDNMHVYTFLFDENLNIIWKNIYATEDKDLYSVNNDIASSFIATNKEDIVLFCNNFSNNDYIFSFTNDNSAYKAQVKFAYSADDVNFFLACIIRANKNLQQTLATDFADLPMLANRDYLSNVFISLEALEFKLADNEKYDLLPYINNAMVNCQRIYKDSINLSEYLKLKNNQISLDRKPIAMQMQLRDIIEKVLHINDAVDISLRVSDDAIGVAANIDEQQMFIAFMNIITNSIKFNPPDVKITIAMTEFEDKIAITFSDNGFGIPTEMNEKVFTPFVSVDQSSGAPKGLGLGLPVAKEIIELHGGNIRLFSGENNGVKIVVHLNKDVASNVRVSSHINLSQNNSLSVYNVFLSDLREDK